MKLTAEQIQEMYDVHIKIIDKYIVSEERRVAIKAMIEKFGENYYFSPASSKGWYHGAYPGGYLNHVNTVVRIALQEMNLYKKMGGTVDFTEEELVFAALFHDLGKLGDEDKPNYLVQDNDWFVKNRQEFYKINPDNDFMLISDRSLYLLQKYGITISQKEWMAIKLHDGLYEDANKAYYISYAPESRLRSNICHILHTADMLAARLETDIESQQ